MIVKRGEHHAELIWSTPGDLPFPMPVEVKIKNEVGRFEMADGRVLLPVPRERMIEIDPHCWLLMELDS